MKLETKHEENLQKYGIKSVGSRVCSFRTILVIFIVVQEEQNRQNFISVKNAILPIPVYSLYCYYRIVPKECYPGHLDTQCNPIINLMRRFSYKLFILTLLSLCLAFVVDVQRVFYKKG